MKSYKYTTQELMEKFDEDTRYVLEAITDNMVFKINFGVVSYTLYLDADDGKWVFLDWCPIPAFLNEPVRVEFFRDKPTSFKTTFTGFHIVSAHTFKVVLVAGTASIFHLDGVGGGLHDQLPIFDYHPDALLHGAPFESCEL